MSCFLDYILQQKSKDLVVIQNKLRFKCNLADAMRINVEICNLHSLLVEKLIFLDNTTSNIVIGKKSLHDLLI